MRRILLPLAAAAALVGVAFFLLTPLSLAASPASDIVSAACANNGALLLEIVAWIGGPVVGASVLANFAHKLPSWAVPIVNFAALNWRSWLRFAAARAARDAAGLNRPQSGVAGKALGLLAVAFLAASTLAACQITGNVKADTDANLAKLKAFAPQVDAYNKAFLAKLADFNAGALGAGLALGKAGCGYAAMLDGQFQLAAPVMQLAGADPGVGMTEAAVFAGVKLACAIVDAADPTAPVTPQVANAVAQVVAAVPQIKADVAKATASAGS